MREVFPRGGLEPVLATFMKVLTHFANIYDRFNTFHTQGGMPGYTTPRDIPGLKTITHTGRYPDGH